MVGLKFIIGLFSIIFAVGCIDGGYNGPMNDNWTGFFIGHNCWFYIFNLGSCVAV